MPLHGRTVTPVVSFPQVSVMLFVLSGSPMALRTGGRVQECEKIAGTIEHFYGHLDINYVKALCLTKVEYRDDVEAREEEIRFFCNDI